MKIGLFYQIQVPKPWNPSSESQRIYEALEQIPYAEQQGFESVDPGFSPQVRVPAMMQSAVFPWKWYQLWNRRGRWVNAFGRLKPGISPQQAEEPSAPTMSVSSNVMTSRPSWRNAAYAVISGTHFCKKASIASKPPGCPSIQFASCPSLHRFGVMNE